MAFFQRSWRVDGEELVAELSAKKTYRAPLELWERIWAAYSNSGQGLQVNQLCREFDIPRRTFLAVKETVGLTHTSVPFPPWIVQAQSPEDLVEETLERKEQDYERKLAARGPDWYRKKYEEAAAKLASQKHVVEALALALRDFQPPNPGRFAPVLGRTRAVVPAAILVLSDWHVGKEVLARSVVGQEFNLKVLTRRVERLAEQVILFLRGQPEIRELVVAVLGDMTDDPMASTFSDQAAFQDARDVDQVRCAVSLLSEFFEALLAHTQVKIQVKAVRGNHGPKGRPLSAIFDELLFDPFLTQCFRGVERVSIETVSSVLATHRVGDALCAFLHGAGLSRDVREADTYRLAALAELMADGTRLGARWRYLFFGHRHHRASMETTHLEWQRCPSLVGGDDYAERELFVTSRPAQSLFLVHPVDGLQTSRIFYLDGEVPA